MAFTCVHGHVFRASKASAEAWKGGASRLRGGGQTGGGGKALISHVHITTPLSWKYRHMVYTIHAPPWGGGGGEARSTPCGAERLQYARICTFHTECHSVCPLNMKILV